MLLKQWDLAGIICMVEGRFFRHRANIGAPLFALRRGADDDHRRCPAAIIGMARDVPDLDEMREGPGARRRNVGLAPRSLLKNRSVAGTRSNSLCSWIGRYASRCASLGASARFSTNS